MNTEVERILEGVGNCRKEISKRIVGQKALIDGMLAALIAGGHVLLEGVPGLAKNLAVKTLADVTGLSFKRIQFTPDLLPADVTGTLIYEPQKGTFSVRKGPVFSNVILADEINRAPAKVQSALLEAMAENQVSIGDTTYRLPEPFFVLATQNPVEQEGTYPLPEAQLDRFLVKLKIDYPSKEEEVRIVLGGDSLVNAAVSPVAGENLLRDFRNALDYVTCEEKLVDYLVSIVTATRPAEDSSGRYSREGLLRYISWGASPRGSIALYRCAKARAVIEGRDYVLPEDIRDSCHDVLRHRLVLSYEAGADGLTADDIITRLLSLIPLP